MQRGYKSNGSVSQYLSLLHQHKDSYLTAGTLFTPLGLGWREAQGTQRQQRTPREGPEFKGSMRAGVPGFQNKA